jgi:hypothetical protein
MLVVLKSPHCLKSEVKDNIREQWHNMINKNDKLIILDRGFDIELYGNKPQRKVPIRPVRQYRTKRIQIRDM